MKKKTVIVTGGTTGIGKATAIAFSKKGFNVVIAGRNEVAAEKVLQEIKETGAEAVFIKTDMRNEEAVIHLIDETVKKFGQLDAIVNNAGVSGRATGLLADTSVEHFKDVIDTNVLGVFLGMKYAIRAMLKTGGGSIVNLASVAGINGIFYGSQYSATKHAVVGLTKSAAIDYATQNIRVNAVAPGAIKTEILQTAINAGTYSEETIAALHPMNRMGKVEDVANAIVYLASDDSTFMTGTILSVDGGYNAK